MPIFFVFLQPKFVQKNKNIINMALLKNFNNKETSQLFLLYFCKRNNQLF
jgi:hypothetical protein